MCCDPFGRLEQLPCRGGVSEQHSGLVVGFGTEEPNAAATQSLAPARHTPTVNGGEELNLHLECRAGSGMAVNQMAHGDVEGGGQNAAVQCALRIEEVIFGVEGHLADIAGIGDDQTEETREKKVSELLALPSRCAGEGGARTVEIDLAGHFVSPSQSRNTSA